MKLNDKLTLYVVTDRTWLGNNSFLRQIEDILKSGATFIQLREKNLPLDKFVSLAKNVKIITEKYNIPLIINDNIDVAILSDASGVHIGQADMDLLSARKRLGKNKIIGVSAQTVEQSVNAEKNGADYIGVGAVFNTSTKKNAINVNKEILKSICDSVKIPVVAIGGINEKNALELKNTGISGIAVISAIFSKPDVSTATKELLELANEIVNNN